MTDTALDHGPLGRSLAYPDRYNPDLLFPIPRAASRTGLAIPHAWHGCDVWNAYEVSWLNAMGKPVVAIARFTVPCDSPQLVESKSFKLYLNSYNEERFESVEVVRTRMAHDLAQATGGSVSVEMLPVRPSMPIACEPLAGQCIDGLDVSIDRYLPAPELLKCSTDAALVKETLSSDLLKSNCPVTGQPDWGSVQVRYTGPQIDHASLLAYIVSMRRHDGFHEHCVERMYCDIWAACQPTSLLVYARYTRRGGLDINPWRSSAPVEVSQSRTPRQ
jgi:7-cyano-7-deazaguanine reductase